ncbi:hypothetical protein [Lysobacter gummosus]|uniref:hypothetical protein n=1 Tax=Lysobacter gummosus TaxID=262324 RepID=UPI00362D9792
MRGVRYVMDGARGGCRAAMPTNASGLARPCSMSPGRHSRERGLRFTSAEPNIQCLSCENV